MPKRTMRMRGPGIEPGPLAGGDFKSSSPPLQHNDLAPVLPSGSGEKRREAAIECRPLATNVATCLLTLAVILGAPALDRWIAHRYQLSTRWCR